MSNIRVLLAQAANFARRENFADAVARARLAHEAALSVDDAAGADLASQALSLYEHAFASWNEAIAKRRALRMENAASDEKKPLPALTS